MDTTYVRAKRAKHSPAPMPQMATGMAIILMLVVAAIHLIEVPSNLAEATYKGMMFLGGGEMALVAAIGIYHGAKVWGWAVGFLIASGAFTLYIVSRTVGLPGLPVDHEWLEPMGILSLLVEGSYIVLCILVAFRARLGIFMASTAEDL